MTNKKTQHKFIPGADRTIVTIESVYGESKTKWTITADGYDLIIRGQYIKDDGTVTEDPIGMRPIDANSLALFI